MKNRFLDFLACLSLSIVIITGPKISGFYNYEVDSLYLKSQIIIMSLIIILLSVFFFFLKEKGLESKYKSVRVLSYSIFLIALVCFLRSVFKIFNPQMSSKAYFSITIITLCLVTFFIFQTKKNQKKTIELLKNTFVILIFPSFLIYITVSDGFFYSSHHQTENKKNNNLKVLWIIFDEWDQHLTFTERPKNLQLDEFDRWKNNYFYASNVLQPGSHTNISLPSYIIGKPVIASKIKNHNSLILTFSDNSQTIWNQKNSIFEELSKNNIQSSLIGWHHPYDRIFPKYSQKSSISSKQLFKHIKYEYLPSYVIFYLLKPLNKLFLFTKTKIFNNFILNIHSRDYINKYRRLLDETKTNLLDPNKNFCFVHFTVPHAIYIYNSETNKIAKKNHTYSDALVHTNQTLKEIRSFLEENDLFENTFIILTSDHWLREEEGPIPGVELITKDEFLICKNRKEALVPLLIKVPNHKKNIQYSDPINSIVIHDLVKAIYNKKVNTELELVSWFESLDPKYRQSFEKIK